MSKATTTPAPTPAPIEVDVIPLQKPTGEQTAEAQELVDTIRQVLHGHSHFVARIAVIAILVDVCNQANVSVGLMIADLQSNAHAFTRKDT